MFSSFFFLLENKKQKSRSDDRLFYTVQNITLLHAVMLVYKLLFSLVLQQANSVGGDENRADINFTKIQLIGLRVLSKKTWIVLAPEWFVDYENGGLSMNLRSRLTNAPRPRLNIWITPSAGVFGNFVGRYTWSIDIGSRYFLFR